MLRHSFTILFVYVIMAGFAQVKSKPAIDFQVLSHDFGTIKEEAGKVSYEFVFTNSGNAPLVIQQVTASCGCTTPSWTKQPIAPGSKGKINVTYDATGRPGHFSKNITVINNSEQSPVHLTISGIVTAQPLSSNQAFPVSLGDIRLKSVIIPIGSVAKGHTKTITIPIFNSSHHAVAITLQGLPKHITATVLPGNVAPGKEARVTIRYNSALVNDWAFRNEKIEIVVNGNRDTAAKSSLTVTAFIAEDFSTLTAAQRLSAPIAVLKEKIVTVGKVKTGSNATGHITVSNNGKSALWIRKAFSDCNCTLFDLPKQGIAPGQVSIIKFTINTGNQPGFKMENINLMTNSPSTPDLQFLLRRENIR